MIALKDFFAPGSDYHEWNLLKDLAMKKGIRLVTKLKAQAKAAGRRGKSARLPPIAEAQKDFLWMAS